MFIIKELTDKEFYTIRDYLKTNFGISLGNEKKGLVYSRLRNRLIDKNMETFGEYFEYMSNEKTGSEVQLFINALTTNHTFFMREPDHFDYFREHALPFAEEACKDKDLRIWCAASSSGEEPYTLQMIMQDYFKNKPGWNLQLLATDISEKVLDRAVRGVYDAESVAPLPDSWKKTYFSKYDANNFIVTDEIKKQIIYRKFNLMDTKFPFKKPFHIIFCRNVMIYFDAETRDSLVRRFYDFTEPNGFLFIGHAESLNHTDTKFKYVKPAVYRKTM